MDDEAATQPPAVRPRRWIRIGLAVLAAVVIAAIAAWTQRLAIAEFALSRAAAAAGVESLTLTIDHLGLERATVSDIAVGGAQRIARIDARYSLRGLWRGSVGHLDVSGLSLRGRVGENGLTLPGLPLPAASNSDSKPTIPVRSIRFRDARLELDTPQGDHSVAADGIVDTLDGMNSDLEASFTLRSAFGTLKAHADATRLGSGEIFGQIVIEDGDITVATVDASGIRGKVQVISVSDGAIDADANLDIKALSVANETLGAARVGLGGRTTNGTDAALEATLQSRSGTVDIAGTLSRSAASGIAASARYTLALVHAALNAKAEGSARIAFAPDGSLVGELEIGDGEAAQDENRISGIAGRTTFVRTSGGALQGTADLSFKTVETHGFRTEPGSVSLTLDDKRVAADAALRWPGGTLSLHAAGPPDGAVQFKTIGQLTNFQPLTRLYDGFAATGRAAFEVAGTFDPPGGVLATMEARPLALIDHVQVNGRIDADIQQADLPGVAQGIALKGRVALSKAGRNLVITTPGTTAMVGSLTGAALARLPEALRTRLAGPVDVVIRPHSADNATVSVTPDATGYAITTNFAANLATKDAALSIAGGTDARFGANGAAMSFATSRMALGYRVREIGRGDLTGQVTLRNLKYEGDQLGSDFDLASTFKGRVDDLLEPLNANAKLSGRISIQGNNVVANIGRGGSLSFDRVVAPDKLAIDTPIRATLTAPARARIDLQEGLPSLDYSAALILPATTVRTKTGESWLEASLSRVPIKAEGVLGKHKIDLEAASLGIPQHELEMSGIALNLEAGGKLRVAIVVDKIQHLGKPTLVTPLRFTGNAAGSGQKVAFDGRVFDPSERISVELSGRHDRETGRGDLSIDAQKLVFLPTVLQPVQLFPVLGSTMREVDGEVDMRANFAWHGDTVTSDMELLVDAKLIKADEFTFENAAAVVRFDSLIPPSTPPKQEVSIGLLDVGVPMLNGRLEFQLNKNGTVRAALRELDFFGGRIETDDFTIPANFDGFTVPLEVNGVELDSLLALAQSGDLTATGTLNGQIPVAIDAGEVAIRNGVLESAPGGGSIRYKPTAVGPSLSEANEGMKLFLQIVDDFQYDKVRVTLDEDAQDEVAFRFKIEGRNQAVYKGIPVELNVSMDGPLRKILTQGLKTYKLPERLLSGMERFKDKR